MRTKGDGRDFYGRVRVSWKRYIEDYDAAKPCEEAVKNDDYLIKKDDKEKEEEEEKQDVSKNKETEQQPNESIMRNQTKGRVIVGS